MTVGICIIAHAPLASALKTCAMHIYSMTGDTAAERIEAYDVPSTVDTEAGLIEAQQRARRLLEESHEGVLVFTDILGATPANIAHRLLDDPHICPVGWIIKIQKFQPTCSISIHLLMEQDDIIIPFEREKSKSF